MSAGHVMDDVTYQRQKKAVWKVTWILGVVTVVEVAIALYYFYNWYVPGQSKYLLNSLFIMMSLAKAFFIIGEFMHLKYEKRALILSLAVPIMFILWAIIAFSWEGIYWAAMRGY